MVRIADTLKQQNDLDTFPVAYADGIWIDKNKGIDPDYKSLQYMYDNNLLGDGSSIEVDTLPIPNEDELGKIYMYIGENGTYKHGYFYECISDGESTPIYSWKQIEYGGIEYVEELPVSKIENKTYGVKEAIGETTVIQITSPIENYGLVTEKQAVDYLSQWFTLTKIGDKEYDITVYPDLTLSRPNWSKIFKAENGDIETFILKYSSQWEFNWTDINGDEISTGAFSSTNFISCTSAYFPIWRYYNGNADEQKLYKISSKSSEPIKDVDTLPSNVNDCFYRIDNKIERIIVYTEYTKENILASVTPLGFTEGTTEYNYQTSSGIVYDKVIYLNNSKTVYRSNNGINGPFYVSITYMFQRQGETEWILGTKYNNNDGYWTKQDNCVFWFDEQKIYAGKSQNNSTRQLAMIDEVSKTFNGTLEEWNTLSTDEKKEYDNLVTPDEPTTDVISVPNPMTRSTTRTSDLQEIGALKQGRIAQIKCYVIFKDIISNTWNTVATVVDSLKPMMETPLIVSEGAVINKVALFRLATDGRIQVWGNQIADGDTTRVSATYFTAN